MDDKTHDIIEEFLRLVGVTPEESTIEQMGVMVEAIKLFEERNARYNDLWKRDGWLGNVFQLTHKASRIRRLFFDKASRGEAAATPDPDDAFDLINYAIFFIRCLRESNRTGI